METLSRLVLTFLLNALWQATLVALVVTAVSRLLWRMPAAYRHGLCIAGLALSFLLPLASVPAAWKSSSPAARADASLLAEPMAVVPRAESLPGLAADSLDRPSTRAKAYGQLHKLLRRRRQAVVASSRLAGMALSVYLIFLLYRLALLARAMLGARKLRGSARPALATCETSALAAQCQAALGLKNVAVCASPTISGPATIGVFRPLIVLPPILLDGPVSEELAAALCHEMAHVRRRDYLLNLICEVLLLSLAFHPAAWLLKRRIDETRELACDEAAARGLPSPIAYARSLVRLAHRIAPSAPSAPYLHSLGVFDANILEERIMRLLDKGPRISTRRARLLLGAAMIAVLLTTLAVGTYSLAAAAPHRLVPSGEPQVDQGNSQVRPGGPGSGVAGGVVGGIPGGVVGGVAKNGVAGGIVGGPVTRLGMVGVIGGTMPPKSGSGAGPTDDNRSAISGTIFDPSGARVPQANVAITNKGTGARESAETNDTGEFTFSDLSPGEYTLTATKVGFGIFAQNVKLSSEKSPSPLNVVLMPGDVLQAIDVTATRTPGARAPAAPFGPKRIRVGGLIEATKLVKMAKPDYPESARAKGIQGVVLLQAVISTEGVPLSLKVISSPDPALSQAAKDAVEEWRYDPTLLNGQPIEVVTTVAVRFHLED